MASRRKDRPVVVEFKDPDFTVGLRDHGLSEEVIEKLEDTAGFGEYWTLQLTFNKDGTFTGKIGQ